MSFVFTEIIIKFFSNYFTAAKGYALKL